MRYFEVRKARIEIIPMIDIMLFLLVFFAMLTLRMIPTSGQVTKLPTSHSAAPLPVPKLLVEIRENGELLVEGHSISEAELSALLKRRDGAQTAVTLSGAHRVNLQQLMRAIDAVKAGGATQIAIATRQPD